MRQDQNPLTVILLTALLIRLVVAFTFQNIVAPDEAFQFLEQAHRLVFGQGIVPWEFQVGLRNWLIPLTLAVPMALVHLFTPNPLPGLWLIRVLLCVASLGIVWAAVKWGEQFFGARGAWVAGLLAACWPDLWLMAPHALEETLAADVLVPAVYLITTKSGLRRTAATAFLLGLAFTLRVQLAPAIALGGVVLCGRDPRRWFVALLIAALPVCAAGVLDWISWGTPFRSFWLNIYLNIGRNVAARQFGASPPGFFVTMIVLQWLWTVPVIAFLVARGMRAVKLPGLMALIIVVTHCLISHKEVRFIFPAIAIFIPVAGVGLAGMTKNLTLRSPVAILVCCFLGGPLVSPWLWFMLNWQTNSSALFKAVSATPYRLISVEGWDPHTPSFLPLDFMLPTGKILTSETTSPAGTAGLIVASADSADIPPVYRKTKCVPSVWIPFAAKQKPDICLFVGQAVPLPGRAPPFEFPFPAAAKNFIIRDRLDP